MHTSDNAASAATATACLNHLHIFGGRRIRVVLREGDPWFVAPDAVFALGLRGDVHTYLTAFVSEIEQTTILVRVVGSDEYVTLISRTGILELSSRHDEMLSAMKGWLTAVIMNEFAS